MFKFTCVGKIILPEKPQTDLNRYFFLKGYCLGGGNLAVCENTCFLQSEGTLSRLQSYTQILFLPLCIEGKTDKFRGSQHSVVLLMVICIIIINLESWSCFILILTGSSEKMTSFQVLLFSQALRQSSSNEIQRFLFAWRQSCMFGTDEVLYVYNIYIIMVITVKPLFTVKRHTGIDAGLCFEDRANRGSTNIIYLFSRFYKMVRQLVGFLRL